MPCSFGALILEPALRRVDAPNVRVIDGVCHADPYQHHIHAGFEGFLLAPYGYGLKVNGLAVSLASAFPTCDHCSNGGADRACHEARM